MANGLATSSGQHGGMPKSLSDKLREALAAAIASGRSMNQIARDADVNVAVVHKFHHGGNINLESAEKLAAALKVSLLR
jgi:DNA-binding phage protein